MEHIDPQAGNAEKIAAKEVNKWQTHPRWKTSWNGRS
jgi:hypothetical protein